MEIFWHKDFLEKGALLLLSVFSAALVGRLFGWLQGLYDVYILLLLLAFFIILLVLRFFSKKIGEWVWNISMKSKFQDPLIAIIKNAECEANPDAHPYTNFLSDDWINYFKRNNFKIETISPTQIHRKYAVIINPYGEVYPEEDPIHLTTLARIKEYIRRGGIFVCAGGIAFYYSWDTKIKRRITLAEELQAYQLQPTGLFVPVILQPVSWSIKDSPVKDHFGVLTTTGNPQQISAYQRSEDIQYVGNIANEGGTNQLIEFRAVREPTRRCIPFLRTMTGFGEVYPVAGIPYDRGCLVLCGMDLSTTRMLGNISLAQSEFTKICVAIKNIIEGIKSGAISYDWRYK